MRVLAVEQYGAGPFGTQFLADQGAEVIKIENPNDGGDFAHRIRPFFLLRMIPNFFTPTTGTKKALPWIFPGKKDFRFFRILSKPQMR